MSKVTNEELNDAFVNFADAMGLAYSPYREEVYNGTIKPSLLPKVDKTLETELTKETKDAISHTGWGSYSLYSWGLGRTAQEATILGKVNAIAEYLGLEFEVQPERVVATKVKAVPKKKPSTSKVKAVKKEKK